MTDNTIKTDDSIQFTHPFSDHLNEVYEGKDVQLQALPCPVKIVKNMQSVIDALQNAPDDINADDLQDMIVEGSESENYRVVFTETGEPVSGETFKAGYHPHHLNDVQSIIESAYLAMTARFKDAEIIADWNNGHCVQVRFAQEIEIAKGDTVKITLTLKACYNGQAFQAIFGLFRLLCTNGMVVPVSGTRYAKFRCRHTKGLVDRIEDMKDQFEQVATQIDLMVDNSRRMAQTMILFDDTYQKVFGPRPADKVSESGTKIANVKQTRYDNVKRAIVDVLCGEQRDLELPVGTTQPISQWMFLNAVQGYFQAKKESDRWNHIAASDWANARPEVVKTLELFGQA
jgi:hypothetical protein